MRVMKAKRQIKVGQLVTFDDVKEATWWDRVLWRLRKFDLFDKITSRLWRFYGN